MKLLAILAALVGLSCTISPVVSGPLEGDAGSVRVMDCRRVSKDYCRDVVGADETEMKKCVSQATYDCVAKPRR